MKDRVETSSNQDPMTTNKPDTGERQAIKDDILAEVEASRETPTPAAGISSETIRRLARAEARPIAKTAVQDHEDDCRKSGGPLCEVAKKVDELRIGFARGMAIVSLAIFAAPIGTAVWLNQKSSSRTEESLRATVNAAADVARQLKAVQDAARSGHTQLEPVKDTRLVQTYYASTRALP